jgi:hypothetical protein
MAEHSDFKNYYRLLGVSQGAPAEEVKLAYRKLAKELHPDRHPEDPAATSKFQALNAARAVLADPEARARYDAACIAPEIPSAPRQAIDPIKCSSCNAVSAQPRYVIFWYVISLVFVTSRRTIQGVFCPSCAPKKAIQASAITWLLGWWGFPWGPIWTIGALSKNLSYGTQPADVNAQILGHQTVYFWDKGKLDLAAAAIEQALHFKIAASLRERLSELKKALPAAPKAQLVDHWKLLRSWGFWVQLMPVLGVVTLMVWNSRTDMMVGIDHHKLAHVGESKSSVLAEPRATAPVLATIRPFENFDVVADRGVNGYERVVTSRGRFGFISKSSIIYGDGMADLRARCLPSGSGFLANGTVIRQISVGPHTLKTTNGLSSDAVVKLREMTGSTVVSFFVVAGGEATINSIPEGRFIIEFATGRDFSPVCGYFLSNMSSRRFEGTESFETQFQGNHRYTSTLKITLNPVVGGTARTVSTDDAKFDHD